MKRLSKTLALSALLCAGLITPISAMIRAIPVHFVNIAEPPATIDVGVGDMLCFVHDDRIGPKVGLKLGPNIMDSSGADGATGTNVLVQSRRPDVRPGRTTVACFDATNIGDTTIAVDAVRASDGSRIDSTLQIKIE